MLSQDVNIINGMIVKISFTDKQIHAPKGGIIIKGKKFKGGEFIPSEGGYAVEYEKMQKEGKAGSSEESKEKEVEKEWKRISENYHKLMEEKDEFLKGNKSEKETALFKKRYKIAYREYEEAVMSGKYDEILKKQNKKKQAEENQIEKEANQLEKERIKRIKNSKNIGNIRGHIQEIPHEKRVAYIQKELKVDKKIAKKFMSSIDNYAGKLSYKDIRNGSNIKDAKIIDEYIEKAPKWDGNGPLYRGLHWKSKEEQDSFLKLCIKGNVIDMRGINSWTSAEQHAHDFSTGALSQEDTLTGVVLKLEKADYGTSIHHISNTPIEEEILMPSNVKFEIVKIEDIIIKKREKVGGVFGGLITTGKVPRKLITLKEVV